MAQDIGKLNVKLGLQNKEFINNINRSKKEVKQFEGAISTAAKTVASFLAVGMIVSRAKQVASQFDELGKAADRLGASAETVQKLALASELGGESFDTIQRAARTMSKQLDAAANQGMKSAADAFERLGVSAKDIMELPLEQQLNVLTGALDKVENQTERNALAMLVFGRSGLSMTNVMASLNMDAERLASMRFLTREQIAKIEAANDAFTALNAQLDILIAERLADLAPLLTGVLKFFEKLNVEIGGLKILDAVDPLKQIALSYQYFFGEQGGSSPIKRAADDMEDLADATEEVAKAAEKLVLPFQSDLANFITGLEEDIKGISPLMKQLNSIVAGLKEDPLAPLTHFEERQRQEAIRLIQQIEAAQNRANIPRFNFRAPEFGGPSNSATLAQGIEANSAAGLSQIAQFSLPGSESFNSQQLELHRRELVALERIRQAADFIIESGLGGALGRGL